MWNKRTCNSYWSYIFSLKSLSKEFILCRYSSRNLSIDFRRVIFENTCGMRLLSQSSSFRRATSKLKNMYCKVQKKKIKWLFHIWLVFITRRVNHDFKQHSINIFCLTNKITENCKQFYHVKAYWLFINRS